MRDKGRECESARSGVRMCGVGRKRAVTYGALYMTKAL